MPTKLPLDPADHLVSGPAIDADLGVTDRCRRDMVADGRLPRPAGYVGGRAVWRRADYLAARERLLAEGRPRMSPRTRRAQA